jgi:hypothetical protein
MGAQKNRTGKQDPVRLNSFEQIEMSCEQWREAQFPIPSVLSCSKDGHASVDEVCSNAHALGVGSSERDVAVGSTYEREELGKLACSRLVLEQVHSMVLELARSKVLALEQLHSKELEQVLARSKVLGLAQVHSKEPARELARSKGQALVLARSMVLELVHNMVLAQGSKLACSNDA